MPESKGMIFSNFQMMLSKVITFLPNLIVAILIFWVGRIITKIITNFLEKLLAKIGIDKISEKLSEIDIVKQSNYEIKVSKIISIFVYYFLLVFILTISVDILNLPSISQLFSNLMNYFPKLFTSILILFVGIVASDGLKKIVLMTLKSVGVASALMISNIFFYFLVVNILLLALQQAEISTSFLSNNLTTILGGIMATFAIGYGIASKDLMTNFITSLYLKDKFRVGDVIAIDGIKGQIIALDNLSFTLMTDDKRIQFPLHRLTSGSVELFSYHQTDIVKK